MSDQEEATDDSSPFEFETLGLDKNWILSILRDAVRSRNYPVLGLFMMMIGSMMKMTNSDFPIWTYRVMSIHQAEQAPYGGGFLWLGEILGLIGKPTSPVGAIRTLVNLSDVLLIAGAALLGSPIIGRLIP